MKEVYELISMDEIEISNSFPMKKVLFDLLDIL